MNGLKTGEVGYLITKDPNEVRVLHEGISDETYTPGLSDYDHFRMGVGNARFNGFSYERDGTTKKIINENPTLVIQPHELDFALEACKQTIEDNQGLLRGRRLRRVAETMVAQLSEEKENFSRISTLIPSLRYINR